MNQATFDAYVQAMRGIRHLAQRDLAAWWATLPNYDAQAVKAALGEFLPLLVASHGEVAATISADFYEQARTDAGVRRKMVVRMAGPVDDALLRSVQHDAIAPLFRETPDPSQALANLKGVVDEMSLQQGRDTVALNAEKDPAKPTWARVPVGKTCSWCITLASRGAVYRSAATAGQAKKFHSACDCQAVPSFDKGPALERKDLPPGYEPQRLYETYYKGAFDAAKAEAGGNPPSMKAIVAQMRTMHGFA